MPAKKHIEKYEYNTTISVDNIEITKLKFWIVFIT